MANLTRRQQRKTTATAKLGNLDLLLFALRAELGPDWGCYKELIEGAAAAKASGENVSAWIDQTEPLVRSTASQFAHQGVLFLLGIKVGSEGELSFPIWHLHVETKYSQLLLSPRPPTRPTTCLLHLLTPDAHRNQYSPQSTSSPLHLLTPDAHHKQCSPQPTCRTTSHPAGRPYRPPAHAATYHRHPPPSRPKNARRPTSPSRVRSRLPRHSLSNPTGSAVTSFTKIQPFGATYSSSLDTQYPTSPIPSTTINPMFHPSTRLRMTTWRFGGRALELRAR